MQQRWWRGVKCRWYWKACPCSKRQHLFDALFAKEWNVFSFLSYFLLYINWIRLIHKIYFYLSLSGRITLCYRRCRPWGLQLVTQPAVSLNPPVGQMCLTIRISPQNLAKPHSLTGLLTLGLEQMTNAQATACYTQLCLKLYTAAFDCGALQVKILRFCLHVTNTTIPGGTKTGLALLTSSAAPLLKPKPFPRQGLCHIHRFS